VAGTWKKRSLGVYNGVLGKNNPAGKKLWVLNFFLEKKFLSSGHPFPLSREPFSGHQSPKKR